jgi:UDP-N-acetylmuramoyl-tripeptide--D-alanyl-D-alanine ligase
MMALSEVARRAAGSLHGADTLIHAVSTDTRRLGAGDLFVALRGERYDGHDYLDRAAAAGAAGALVSRLSAAALPQVQVDDTLRALQRLAADWRAGLDLPLVAVTGSNGKTTVKQMLSAVLAGQGPVLATEGNLNNHIGVPLTLLRLRPEHRFAVVEMGANHGGEIALLARLAQPRVGVVTNAGDAHLEGFGSRDGVARAKGELFEALGAHGVAVINADDVYAGLWQQLAGAASRISFGLGATADVTAAGIYGLPVQAPQRTAFELRAVGHRTPVELPLPGTHNVTNALAAAAAALALGMDVDDIARGLSDVQPAVGRLTWRAGPYGSRLLDDSYNANPDSLEAGLALLAQAGARRWLVLGDMAELGARAEELHLQAGHAARRHGVERVYALGRHARFTVTGFGGAARAYDDAARLVADLRSEIEADVVLLVKGSRASQMERVVEALAATQAGTDSGGAH